MREVVGVALVHDGRVLAARRARPAALAGCWEFPGGKVEPGEDPTDTAVRELHEELGCTVAVSGWLPGRSMIATATERSEELVLRIALARLVAGDPVPSEHDAVRWLGAVSLPGLTWVEADVPFLAPLGALLGAP